MFGHQVYLAIDMILLVKIFSNLKCFIVANEYINSNCVLFRYLKQILSKAEQIDNFSNI